MLVQTAEADPFPLPLPSPNDAIGVTIARPSGELLFSVCFRCFSIALSEQPRRLAKADWVSGATGSGKDSGFAITLLLAVISLCSPTSAVA
jgi:hypothetical protein